MREHGLGFLHCTGSIFFLFIMKAFIIAIFCLLVSSVGLGAAIVASFQVETANNLQRELQDAEKTLSTKDEVIRALEEERDAARNDSVEFQEYAMSLEIERETLQVENGELNVEIEILAQENLELVNRIGLCLQQP